MTAAVPGDENAADMEPWKGGTDIGAQRSRWGVPKGDANTHWHREHSWSVVSWPSELLPSLPVVIDHRPRSSLEVGPLVRHLIRIEPATPPFADELLDFVLGDVVCVWSRCSCPAAGETRRDFAGVVAAWSRRRCGKANLADYVRLLGRLGTGSSIAKRASADGGRRQDRQCHHQRREGRGRAKGVVVSVSLAAVDVARRER